MQIQNPILTKHSQKRVHERFGIPLKETHSWIAKKLRDAEYLGFDGRARVYRNGGARFVVKGDRLVVSVTQIT